MNLFGVDKPEPKSRRKTRKSRKWLNYVKKQAAASPDLAQMVDDPVLKAAVLCRDNGFTLKISDFNADTMQGMAFIQYMISVIEAVRNENPPILDDMKWEAIREGTKIIEQHSRHRRSLDVDEEIREESPDVTSENEPPAYIRPIIKPKVSWPRPQKKTAPEVAPANPPGEDLLQLINTVKGIIEAGVQAEEPSSSESSEIIAVDADGNGTLVEMTRAGYELWKHDREEIKRLKQQGPQANGATDQK